MNLTPKELDNKIAHFMKTKAREFPDIFRPEDGDTFPSSNIWESIYSA